MTTVRCAAVANEAEHYCFGCCRFISSIMRAFIRSNSAIKASQAGLLAVQLAFISSRNAPSGPTILRQITAGCAG